VEIIEGVWTVVKNIQASAGVTAETHEMHHLNSPYLGWGFETE